MAPAAALKRVFGFALAHFAAAMLASVVARGLDLDQLSSRSPASRVAHVVETILMAPHDAALRAVPPASLAAHPGRFVPTLLILNSLLWGVVLAAIATAWSRSR